jgi:hypothetical protein
LDYADGREAKTGIGKWIAFHNGARPHRALGYRMPMALWRHGQTVKTGGAGCGPVDTQERTPQAHGNSGEKLLRQLERGRAARAAESN